MFSIFSLFVPAIRDYIDVINNVYDSYVGNIHLFELLQQNFIYLVASIKFFIFYFLSFQWIQDLSSLPVVIPQIKLEILKEHFFLQNPQSNFFTFLEIPSYTNNKFFLGFVNSFFLCLPLSVGHLIFIRRLLIQGLLAGVFSSLGTSCGQILLLICIVFGGRFFIIPWFHFQVFNYFIGLWLVLKIVFEMSHERSIRIIDNSNISTLIRIFFLNFALTWTEQTCIFQYFGNLTLGAEPSIIEIFSSLSILQLFLTHVTYISGIIVGTIFWNIFFIWFTLKISNLCVQFFSILYSRWIRRLNFSLLITIIAFTFSSIPFYSFDYLILSNFGFVPQDKSFQNTIFSPTKIHDVKKAILGDEDLPDKYLDMKPGLDTDITPFNKGRYLMFDVNDSFEQLNYQGEYAWLTQKDRTITISRDPSSSRVFSKLVKFFKKNKKSTNRVTDKNKFSSSSNDKSDKIAKNNSDEEQNTAEKQDLTQTQKNKVKSRNIKNELLIMNSFEKIINTSASSKFFIDHPFNQSILKKKFQQRYYSNPIYKLLLSTDIDFFLSRQPKYIKLSPKQEHELFKKRLVLANYYDSLRYYNQLPYLADFNDTFHGSKSYADRVYNHQFHGTLKIVRRLFSINENLNDLDINANFTNLGINENLNDLGKNENLNDLGINNSNEKSGSPNIADDAEQILKKTVQNEKDWFVLKFDQPLYKKINRKNDAHSEVFFHEELNLNRNSNLDRNRNLKKSPLYDPNFSKKDISNQLEKNFYTTQLNPENEPDSVFPPFIEFTNPIPLYVGWDEQLRKLVITNRLLPNKLTGESMKFFSKNFANEYLNLNKFIKKNKTITFTTWPISSCEKNKPVVPETFRAKTRFQKSNLCNKIPYNFLVDSLQDSNTMNTYNTLIENTVENALYLKIHLDENGIPKNAYNKIFSSIPANILSRDMTSPESQMQDIMPYTRGGFIWPGHANLKLNFKNLISNNSTNK